MNCFRNDPVLGLVCNGSSLLELNMATLTCVLKKTYILLILYQEQEADKVWLGAGEGVLAFLPMSKGSKELMFNKMRDG